jgi:hypothetical protein
MAAGAFVGEEESHYAMKMKGFLVDRKRKLPVYKSMFDYFDLYFHLNHVNEWTQVELNSMMKNPVHVIDSLLINIRQKKIVLV